MFKSEVKGNLFIVRVDKKDATIDINNVAELKEVLKDGIGKGYKKIIVDFKNITYIDSSGLGCLMDAMKELKNTDNGELGILSISPDVLEVFTATKIGQFFKYYKSI